MHKQAKREWFSPLLLIGLLILSLVILKAELSSAQEFEAPLAFWLLPEQEDHLPHHVEYDQGDVWKEMWIAGPKKSSSKGEVFSSLYERSLGIRWAAFDGDSNGNPAELILVFNNHVIWKRKDNVKVGKLSESQIKWDDSSTRDLFEFRKRRSGRKAKRPGRKISFSKVVIPKDDNKETSFSPSMVEGLSELLTHFANGDVKTSDLAVLSKLSNAGQSGFLNFGFADNCSLRDRKRIEEILVSEVSPRLDCLASQDEALRSRMLTVLLQHPIISCKAEAPMDQKSCGMALLPLRDEFFVKRPQVTLAMNRCEDQTAITLTHEILHLFGFSDKDKSMEKAELEAGSCSASLSRELHSFEEPEQTFVNDFQVQSRFALFTAVRTLADTKWGWTPGEKAYVLGSLCAEMSDALCARRYFTEAVESSNGLGNDFTTDDGVTSTYSAAASFGFFDSIKEDRPRMHELVRYLKRDPTAALLRRREKEGSRSHEFYVAKTTLQKIKDNKNICDDEVDDHVACDDLSDLSKTNWFLR